MNSFSFPFILANLAASGAILLVLLLRKPIRAWFGARLAYALWLLVPLAVLASLIPRVTTIIVPAFDPGAIEIPPLVLTPPVLAAAPLPEPFDPWSIATPLWIAGVLAMALWQLRGQLRFLSDARAGLAGPAVVGVIRPRIVTPSDFEERFDPREQDVILSHEKIHLAHNDARINALVAFLRCACWFNPLVHLAAYVMRIDQELACDAAVVERHPRAKALYASALLKAQLAVRPLPLGCYWPAGSDHPLTERIEMLKQTTPNRMRRMAGAACLAALSIGAGFAAWAAKPAEERYVEEAPAPAPPAAIQPATAQVPAEFDTSDPILLVGRIATVREDHGKLLITVRSATELWELSPIEFVGKPDRPIADLMHEEIEVYGYEPRAKNCTPNCRIFVSDLRLKSSAKLTPASDTRSGPNAEPDPDPAPAPAPEPQEQRNPPLFYTTSIDKIPDGYAKDPLYLRGKVERIEFADTTYTLFVRATSLTTRPPPRMITEPNSNLWQLSPTTYFGDREAIRKDMLDRQIELRGYQSNDKSCSPTCRVHVGQLFIPKNTAVTRPTPTINEFGWAYDTSAPAVIRGTVERIEFAERTFDAYVRSNEVNAPGIVYQVRTEYTLPRADIEKALLNQLIVAGGWRARGADYTVCGPVCGMYGTTLTLEPSRVHITPAGDKLVQDPPSPVVAPTLTPSRYEPQQTPASPFTSEKPVTVTGRITRIELLNPVSTVWVQAESVKRGRDGKPEADSKLWRVFAAAEPNAPNWARDPKSVGMAVAINGFEPADANCAPECSISGRDIKQASGYPMPGITFGTGFWLPPSPPLPTSPQPATQPIRYDPQQGLSASPDRSDVLALLEVRSAEATRRIVDLEKRYRPAHPELQRALQEQADIDRLLKTAEQQAQATSPPPGWKPFAATFDADDPILLNGVVDRVEINGGMTILLVKPTSISRSLKDVASPTDRLWRVEAGRADGLTADMRDKALPGRNVVVRGYGPKEKACGETCLMNGRDLVFPTETVKPTSAPDVGQPTVQPIRYEPQAPQTPRVSQYYSFASVFDANDPIVLKGELKKTDYVEPYAILWIEGWIAARPKGGATQTAADRKLWRVETAPPSKITPELRATLTPGKELSLRGFNATDKTCNPTCRMNVRLNERTSRLAEEPVN